MLHIENNLNEMAYDMFALRYSIVSDMMNKVLELRFIQLLWIAWQLLIDL